MKAICLASVFGIFAATPALAADQQPVMAPTRAVSVTYAVHGARKLSQAGKLEVTYAAGAERVRLDFYQFVESAQPTGSLIFDRPDDRVVTLIDARKAYLQRNVGGLANPGLFLSPALTYTRDGTETFAGLSCTEWAVTHGAETGRVCVTDDGVVLKAEHGGPKPEHLDAIAVTYGAPPPSAFSVPAGYTRLPTRAPAR